MSTDLLLARWLMAGLVACSPGSQVASPVPESAAALVQALGEFPAGLPARAPSDGILPPLERHRLEVYDRLWSLGSSAVPALCLGLSDSDVQVRRNVALFLSVAGNDWYDRQRPRLAIAPCASALARALEDSDERVRGLAAQAVAATGAAGAVAVPALIAMLGSPAEGDRNAACIGLRGLGPVARAALPALRKLLSDPSPDVRGFAQRAIERDRTVSLARAVRARPDSTAVSSHAVSSV